MQGERITVGTGCVLLILGVWTELVQRFIFRLRFGYLDTCVRKVSSKFLYTASPQAFESAHPLDLVSDFILLFGRLVVVVILSYTAVYVAIELTLSPGAFAGEIGSVNYGAVNVVF